LSAQKLRQVHSDSSDEIHRAIHPAVATRQLSPPRVRFSTSCSAPSAVRAYTAEPNAQQGLAPLDAEPPRTDALPRPVPAMPSVPPPARPSMPPPLPTSKPLRLAPGVAPAAAHFSVVPQSLPSPGVLLAAAPPAQCKASTTEAIMQSAGSSYDTPLAAAAPYEATPERPPVQAAAGLAGASCARAGLAAGKHAQFGVAMVAGFDPSAVKLRSVRKQSEGSADR
jgi:hypothetical protein